MKWTKRHSRNAIAAKSKLRLQRAKEDYNYEPQLGVKPPKLIPDFTINIRTRKGDRLKITATRWHKQFITGDGIKSARQITRGIEVLIRNMAL